MYYGEYNNHKSRIIGKWLSFEIDTQRIKYEIFLEYNPEYPHKTDKYINQLVGDIS